MFELTPEQRDIKQAAREFAEKEFKEIARELDEKEQFDERLWKRQQSLDSSAFLSMKPMAAPDWATLNNVSS